MISTDARHTLSAVTSYRTGHDAKNVDYAAYEYNVYVQCSYMEGKKKKSKTRRTANKETVEGASI
jgi:hypothetical protein